MNLLYLRQISSFLKMILCTLIYLSQTSFFLKWFSFFQKNSLSSNFNTPLVPKSNLFLFKMILFFSKEYTFFQFQYISCTISKTNFFLFFFQKNPLSSNFNTLLVHQYLRQISSFLKMISFFFFQKNPLSFNFNTPLVHTLIHQYLLNQTSFF